MYYGRAGTSLLNESPCKGELLAVNREKQERQAHETSVHWKGRTNAFLAKPVSAADCLQVIDNLLK